MNEERRLFRNCALVSASLHAALAGLLVFILLHAPAPPVEIDLTNFSFLGTGPAKLGAPKAAAAHPKPGPALPATPTAPAKPVAVPSVSAQTEKKPTPIPSASAQEEKKPAPVVPPPPPPAAATRGGVAGGAGTSPLTGGSGKGANFGTPNGAGNGGVDLLSLPRLLNLDEIMADLQRFYPESERRAGHEGEVLVNIHIGVDGLVKKVDVVQSAGPAFDSAASKVAFLMRFSPAMARSGPVAVVIRQAVIFHLSG